MTVLLDQALARAADRLDGTADTTRPARARLLSRCPTALDVAARFERGTTRTPALTLVADRLQQTVDTVSGRLVVSIAPQEGKSTLLRWLCVRLLLADPSRRLVYASFAHSLAQESGGQVRDTVAIYGDQLGLSLDPGRRAEGDWRLAGHRGGMYSVGVGGALTGRPADVLVIDDPLRNQRDADSPLIREKLWSWWTSVARTRLAPGAPVIVVQTRWAEDDLAGRLVDEGWPLVNIPALADGRTEDALDRPPGTWLQSSRGRTVAQWEETRRAVGERVFAAMYQGRPAPLEGGIFKQAWFDTHREPVAPPCDLVAVIVDPADTGQRDAAGILVMGRTRDGRIPTLADMSGQFSQAQWGRRACLGWLRWGAARIVQETNLGMRTTIPDAWSIIYRQATALTQTDGDPDAALALLTAGGDRPAADGTGLRELTDLYPDVIERGPDGPRVVSILPKASKRVRAETVAAAYETGRAFMVGQHRELEHEATTWQEGQPSPNRLDTLAMGAAHLEQAGGPVTVKRPRRRKDLGQIPALRGAGWM